MTGEGDGTSTGERVRRAKDGPRRGIQVLSAWSRESPHLWIRTTEAAGVHESAESAMGRVRTRALEPT